MLKSHAVLAKVLTPWKPATSRYQLVRLLSTNTAINRSLRKSQSQIKRSSSRYQARAKPSSKPPEKQDRLLSISRDQARAEIPRTTPKGLPRTFSKFRPRDKNFHKRTDDTPSESYGPRMALGRRLGHVNRYDNAKTASLTRGKPSMARSGGPGVKSQYDYSEKPGGNRAARRDSLFGRKPRTPDLKENNDVHGSLSSLHHNAANGSGSGRYNDAKASTQITLIHDEAALNRSWQRHEGLPPATLEQRTYRHEEVPVAIPYTTSASEFLYGTSVIRAALEAKRRKCYKLYMYDGDNREARDQDTTIRRLATDNDIVIQRVKGEWLKLMDKMSQGRPHNVCKIGDIA